jgi:hypothetical protein
VENTKSLTSTLSRGRAPVSEAVGSLNAVCGQPTACNVSFCQAHLSLSSECVSAWAKEKARTRCACIISILKRGRVKYLEDASISIRHLAEIVKPVFFIPSRQVTQLHKLIGDKLELDEIGRSYRAGVTYCKRPVLNNVAYGPPDATANC